MHPNQLALPGAVDRWIDQSHQLDDETAIARLADKRDIILGAINIIASDSDDLPVELEGLSMVCLMAASDKLTIEINTRRRLMKRAA